MMGRGDGRATDEGGYNLGSGTTEKKADNGQGDKNRIKESTLYNVYACIVKKKRKRKKKKRMRDQDDSINNG